MPASEQPADFSRTHRGFYRSAAFERGHRLAERSGLIYKPQTIVGVNMWQAMHLGLANPPGDRQRLKRELDHLNRLGVNNLRIIAGSEGPADAPYRVTPPLLTAPGNYDERVFDGLDFALAEIAARDMQAVLVLNNFWEWSGGMAAYVAWTTGEAIPYPRDGRYEDFLAYATRFYALPECQRWYRDHIAAIITRENRYTGRTYRDEPGIFSWQLANEPRYYPIEWIAETAGYIRSLDPHHMISTGSEGSVGGDFLATHRHDAIDYATVHIWPQNWGWYDPDRPETYEAAEAKARAYLAEHIAGAAELGKPLVLEEFGLPRDGATEAERYDPASPTTIRNRFFAAMYAEVERSIEANGPLQGSNLWAWTGEGRPGDELIGDPKHEPPGWYSVYDTDAETLDILGQHAGRIVHRA